MKDKKKQIEEIAKDVGKCLYPRVSCEKCYCKDELCFPYAAAKLIYKKHYQKIDKNKVVLTKEEYQKDFSSQFNKGYEQGSKETAEKFAKAVKDRIKFIKTYLHVDGVEYLGLEDFDVDNILIGDFGVEIKE